MRLHRAARYFESHFHHNHIQNKLTKNHKISTKFLSNLHNIDTVQRTDHQHCSRTPKPRNNPNSIQTWPPQTRTTRTSTEMTQAFGDNAHFDSNVRFGEIFSLTKRSNKNLSNFIFFKQKCEVQTVKGLGMVKRNGH